MNNNNLQNIKLIVLDIDETLTDNISWTYITTALGADANKHQEIYEKFKNGELDYKNAKSDLLKLWKETGNNTRSFMKDAFNKIPLKKDAVSVVTKLMKKYQILLISGSMDLYVETVAEKLNINTWYSNTELLFNFDGILVDFNYELDQAQKKLEQFTEFSRKENVRFKESAVVGDGENDQTLFKNLGFRIILDTGDNRDFHSNADIVIKELSELIKIFL